MSAGAPGGGPPLADDALPRASVVVLNCNGKHHLAGCLDGLAASRYPRERFEVILVDNGSKDGSQRFVEERYPWVRLVHNGKNLGFSGGCNQGARIALDAGVLVFLNNDLRVEPDFLRELVAPVERGECAATTAKMLSWDGRRVDSAGGAMNFHGIGIQKGMGETPSERHDAPARVLFACGGAMAVDAATFADVGGFDEEFFAYYEDVDFGWRLWVLGHEVHYAPRAVCYHRHSSTSRTFPVETIRLLQVRNPFLACFKNYDDENLRRVLPASLALAVERAWLAAGMGEASSLRIENVRPRAGGGVGSLLERVRKNLVRRARVRRVAVADLLGLSDLFGRWDHWRAKREAIQRRRRRPDAEILRLFEQPLWCIEKNRAYRELHEGAVEFFGIREMFVDGDPSRRGS